MPTTTKSPRVVFFGNEQLATGTTTRLPILNALLNSGCTIAAIVLNSHTVTSRSKKQPAVEEFAAQNNIPVLKPARPQDVIPQLQSLGADCGVLAAYGRIVSQQIIDVFPHGIINLHPSLLPNHRGPTPIEQTILDGDTTAGVSIISLTSGMDEGPIYATQHISLTGNETKQDLADTLGQMGAKLIAKILPQVLSGQLQPSPQPTTGATYCKLLSKQDSVLNTLLPADQLQRQVRAFAGFPKSKLVLNGQQLVITSVHTSSQAQSKLSVLCGDGQYLIVDTLVAPSGKSMLAADYMRGYLKS